MVNLVKIGPVDPQMIGLKEIIKKKLTLAEHKHTLKRVLNNLTR